MNIIVFECLLMAFCLQFPQISLKPSPPKPKKQTNDVNFTSHNSLLNPYLIIWPGRCPQKPSKTMERASKTILRPPLFLQSFSRDPLPLEPLKGVLMQHPEVPFSWSPTWPFKALYGLYKQTSVAHYQTGATAI